MFSEWKGHDADMRLLVEIMIEVTVPALLLADWLTITEINVLNSHVRLNSCDCICY